MNNIKDRYKRLFQLQFKTPLNLNEIKSKITFNEPTKAKKTYFGIYILSTIELFLCICFLYISYSNHFQKKTKFPPITAETFLNDHLKFFILSFIMFLLFIITILVIIRYYKGRR